MARDQPQINIRIPAELRDRLDKAMEKSGRSLTAEIVARLEQSLLQASADPQADAVIRYMLALNAYEARKDSVSRMVDEFGRKKRKTEEERAAIHAAQAELILVAGVLDRLKLEFESVVERSAAS
ncbi:Arc family DNA-binding protein [Tahibacter soli]|uniref:Arc family DNA-binding protein n=1 Tax=Tahibacter soli TaxID=2983605 RepID=A0A9X3YJX0_9GAMM|nr:Arc family DNA-binding protein [Tahibacter soli]MDC8013731.1 Arc family DNA-binding protein [Tahibacter soli]